MILELKVDDTPEKAIDQIKEKKYDLRFRGKTGEKPSLLDCTRGRPPKGVLPPVSGTGATRRVGKKPPLLDCTRGRSGVCR